MEDLKRTRNIVLVVDRVNSRDNVDIYTDTLEFTSNVYFDALENALKHAKRKYYVYNSPQEFIDNIEKHKNDIVFSAIWSGTISRNRKSLLPAICESYKIDYIGADVYTQTICQDKYLSKIFCKNYGIEIPKGYIFDDISNLEIIKGLNFPLIIKPNCEGSSIGISDNNIVDNYNDAYKLAKKLLKKFKPIIVEEYVDGDEVSVCLVGKNSVDICEAIALTINGNTYFSHQIWGFESKKCGRYEVGRKCVTSQVSTRIIDACKKIFLDLKKVDYMRIDGRIKDNKFYLIELTPDCSLHPECFMANTFYSNNLSYNDMIEKFISLYD